MSEADTGRAKAKEQLEDLYYNVLFKVESSLSSLLSLDLLKLLKITQPLIVYLSQISE